MEIPVHQRNTKFVNNLPSYWGKYVTIVKNSKDISTVSYVDLYTHLKNAMTTSHEDFLCKMNQIMGIADQLLTWLRGRQLINSSHSQSVPQLLSNAPAPQQAFSQPIDAMLATMTDCELLSRFQTQFSSTTTTKNFTNPRPKYDSKAGQITKESDMWQDCNGEERERTHNGLTDRHLLMEAKEKGVILDAKAEAFLADVEYCPSTGLMAPVSQEIHKGEQLDSDVDSVIDDHDNTIPYHQYHLNNKVESVPTDVFSVIPGEISVITILDDLRSQLEGHIKTNDEQSFANVSLKAELERYKTQVQNLEQSKVKKDLEQLVFERNKRNADLEEQCVSLKQQLLQHVESTVFENRYSAVSPNPVSGDRIVIPVHTHSLGIEDNLFKEVYEYMKIFDELDKEYDQCVIDKKSLEIENKNLLIQNECLLAESVSKDICSVVLTSVIAEPINNESRSNCVKEHSINLELEAEIIKVKQLLVEKVKRCSFIETKYQELELKFQKYKECFENPQVCNNSSSPELNVFFEINKLKDQLQGKDELLGKLKAQIEELTAVRIKNDSLRDENVSIKKRYQDLYQSKAEINSNVSSRATVPEKPKVLAPGLYAMTPKYIPPQKRNNREANTHLPKEKEVSFAKPHHMITPGSSRYSSNDMVHNRYLEEAKKQTYEIGRNSKTSVIPSARSQSIANGSKPKPRINNQKSRNWPVSKTSYITTMTVPIAEHSRNSRNFFDSKHFVCSTCQKCVFNANHDHCVTKFLNEVNSRAKVPSNKTTNRNKPVEQISVAKKPERQISKGHRWVPTGKIFTSSTTKVDSEPTNGSDEDITNQYEYKQTLDVSAGNPNLSAGTEINNLQSGRIGSGLVTTPTTPSVPPTEKYKNKKNAIPAQTLTTTL
ncbi:hypothetical protein Tco_0951283 [Tanacetum coccineum]|uniref:Uncharacterized protein n=1 Tax=Tanacetum coccineum TaxID=301880 RepID=A0ABQ5DWF7_9ASTR